MPPETPKRSADKAFSLTPAFSFSLANSPSFRFASPRGINILSSLSPHRFFSKNKDTYKPESAREGNENAENETTFESVKTSDSAEMWSLADDSQSLSMNLTSINEESDKDVYFSPNEFLLGSLFEEDPKPAAKKRKTVSVDESPCKKLAGCIGDLNSPKRDFTPDYRNSPNKNKVWTAHLDDELLRCHAKYSAFKARHGSDPTIFRATSQNKILSRMLLNKTGILRSAKQISTRLSRLIRSAIPEINVIPDLDPSPETNSPSNPAKRNIPSSPHQSDDLLVSARLHHMNLSFKYMDAIQGSHVFTEFEAGQASDPEICSISKLREVLPTKSGLFLQHFEEISSDLARSKTGICNVSCELNFNSESNAASSPISPMTDPRQFTMSNGNFSSSLLVKLPLHEGSESCKSFILSTTIYKNEKVLHRSQEMVNGFASENQILDVEVPFLNRFWAGYLSYLSNGTQDYNDLENLVISQTIHERNKDNNPLSFLVFTFSPAKTQIGSAKASLHLLRQDNTKPDEADELETMVVSSPALASSPFQESPKRHFHINTNFASGFPNGPSSAPIYNSSLLHSFTGSHSNTQKPQMQHSKSATFLGSKQHSSLPQSQSQGLLRHSSAGHVPTMANINGHISNVQLGLLHESPQNSMPGALIDAPPMAYFHHPQPPQFPAATGPPRQTWVPLPEQNPVVQSAPSSQVGFVTRYAPVAVESDSKLMQKQKQGVKFGPILSYDPSQSIERTSQQTETTGSSYQHRFSVPPRELFQPHYTK